MIDHRVLAIGVAVAVLTGHAHAQPSAVAAADIPGMKLNHYFTPDKKNHEPDFTWTFTKSEFVIKKGAGPIPKHLIEKLLPEGVTGDEITGSWKLKDGKLELTDIKVGDKAGKKDVSLPVFKTAPTVVRVCDPDQFVFGVSR
ncbi:hypothetical protein VT84_15415 [Gemmata sp. SH-PL17]|uniref:hypothetical protein n=1 Tax=Gemmata sp. SH-PL17 TaxID=1630693 RepID=UPI00078CCF27|nr:hypothetical protein [Gemmata sp. SH-PL17]AMV25785.1 hypothetical protein VT84_15415 [Gemmata sp. SH-PL17]